MFPGAYSRVRGCADPDDQIIVLQLNSSTLALSTPAVFIMYAGAAESIGLKWVKLKRPTGHNIAFGHFEDVFTVNFWRILQCAVKKLYTCSYSLHLSKQFDVVMNVCNTHLVTYQTNPVELSRTSRLLTVTSWNVARFSLRKNVSGIQILFQWSSPRRTLSILGWIGLKASRRSHQDCRRYMLTE